MCLCLTEIRPIDPVIEAGATLNITCTLRGHESYNSSVLYWVRPKCRVNAKYYHYTSLARLQLSIPNALPSDGGMYICKTLNKTYLGRTLVRIGCEYQVSGVIVFYIILIKWSQTLGTIFLLPTFYWQKKQNIMTYFLINHILLTKEAKC